MTIDRTLHLHTTAAQGPARASAPAPSELRRSVLRAKGFSCPSCVRSIEGRLTALPGVRSAQVHFASQKIVVEHDPALVPVDALVAAVADAGYESTPAAF